YYVTKDKDLNLSFYKIVFLRGWLFLLHLNNWINVFFKGKKWFTPTKLALSPPIQCWTMSSTLNIFLGACKTSNMKIEVYNLDPRQGEATQELYCTLEDTSLDKICSIACCNQAICVLGTRSAPEAGHK